MLQVAAEGHRTLCAGQGAELCWARRPGPLTSLDVLDIFRRKTAPAFEVALRLGSIYGGGDDAINEVIAAYSESLGIAYQIRDDISDLSEESESDDVAAMRPTLPLALGHERGKGEEKEILASVWRREPANGTDAAMLRAMLGKLGVEKRARELLEAYKEQAIGSLKDLGNPSLKGLLRRVIGKIFNDAEIKGWCNEFETRNAAGRQAGSPPSQ